MGDVLEYYGKVAPYLKKFLKGKEIASKIHIKSFTIIKRGSKDKPLFIKDLIKAVDKRFLDLRKEHHLKDVKDKLDENQINVWDYFVPRKLSEFLYATNNEGPGKDIERIFLDVDRTNLPAEISLKVTKELVKIIIKDKEFNGRFKNKLFVMWTGSSFHIYLMLEKKIKNFIYHNELAYGKSNPSGSFVGRWIEQIKNKVNVIGGHEKLHDHIVIDPSQTPSGKLGRVPFSLHVKNNKIDGIALPLGIKDLDRKDLVKKLKAYTPEKVLKEIRIWSKKMP